MELKKSVIIIFLIFSLLLLTSCTVEEPKDMITGDFRFIDIFTRVSSLECSDSDNGLNTHIQGTTYLTKKDKRMFEESKTDYCLKSNKLKVVEFYCEDNEIKSSIITCEDHKKCVDGMCKGYSGYDIVTPKKADGSYCENNEECISYICAAPEAMLEALSGKVCMPATCYDDVLNQDETYVDCGGICTEQFNLMCGIKENCNENKECLSNNCIENQCQNLAEIKVDGGVPTLFINGQKEVPIVFAGQPWIDIENIDLFFEQVEKASSESIDEGVHIVRISNFLKNQNYEGYTWDTNDFLNEGILERDPNAYLIPSIYLEQPVPEEEKVLFDNGENEYRASIASEIWKENTADALREYLDHIKNSEYSDRVIGVSITYLETAEWFYFSSGWNFPHFEDYSEPSTKKFRKSLEQKYGYNVNSLKSSWNDPTVTFENAEVPSSNERLAGDSFFRDTNTDKKVIDYLQFSHELVPETIDYFANLIKEETNDQFLVLAYYGYNKDLMANGHRAAHNSGHFALDKLLNTENIDFVIGPESYDYRSLGESGQMKSSFDSMNINGKILMNEEDTRTYLAPSGSGFGYVNTLEKTKQILRRNFARTMIHNGAIWYLDLLNSGWFNSDEIWDEIKKFKTIYKEYLNEEDRTLNPDIAVIMDEDSLFYQKYENKMLKTLLPQQSEKINKAGVTYGYYLHNDIENIPDAKVYIFLNTFYLTEEEKQEINKLKKDNNVLVWIYAPGYMTENGPSLESTEELTGFYLGITEDSPEVWLRSYTGTNHPLVKEPHKIEKFGTTIFSEGIYPVFYIEDEDATTLGQYYQTDLDSFAVKEFNNWKSIYIGTPLLSDNLIRNIADYAGAHIYLDTNDVFDGNNNYIMIHTRSSGVKNIKLSKDGERYNVYELFDGESYLDVTEIFPNIEKHKTKLYKLEKI